MARVDNPVIGFMEEDARLLHQPHDNALVVSIRVGDYNTYKVLVDNRSPIDILYYPAFQQMRIERERLIQTNAPLVGFGGRRVYLMGAVTLLVMVRDYHQQLMKDVTFLVVDCSSTYNAILGRPTLNSWKAVTLTYHLMIKFPTEYEVGEVRGDQMAASTSSTYHVSERKSGHICLELRGHARYRPLSHSPQIECVSFIFSHPTEKVSIPPGTRQSYS